MKRTLTSLAAGLMALAAIFPSSAADVRSVGGGEMSRGCRLSLNENQRAVITAVQPERGAANKFQFARLKENPLSKNPQKVSASGATLQGLHVDLLSGDKYWGELFTDGTVNKFWDAPYSFINTGFLRNGCLYGFSSSIFMQYAFLSHGVFSLSGECLEWVDDDDYFDDFSRYVFQCAYNPESDKAYAYTLNSDGTAYMFQSIDPETSEFSVINPNVILEDVCAGMTWNAHEGKLYGYTPDRRICEIDPSSGALTMKMRLDRYDVSTSCQGFVYSPLDKAFFLVMTAGATEESPILKINPSDWSYEEVGSLNYVQFPILVCGDTPAPEDAPLAPEINEFVFSGGSTRGVIKITFPGVDYSGSPLTGDVSLKIKLDNEEYGEYTGKAGETVEVNIEAEEGEHWFSFQAFSASGIAGPAVEKHYYIGFDEPLAPENVILEEGKLTWKPVVRGVHDGYIDVANLGYNVYLDDLKLNDSLIYDTQYVFDMPDLKYGIHCASVVAVNKDMVSQKGYSNGLLAGSGYQLPFRIEPTEDDMALLRFIDSNDDFNGWMDFISGGAIECYNGTDDWMILPPVELKASEKLYKVRFDAMCGDSSVRNMLEVSLGDGNVPDGMITLEGFDVFSDTEFQTYEVYFYNDVDKDAMVAFHSVSPESYGDLFVRNIEISHSDMSVSCPSAPIIKSVTPAERGELKAEVEFELPRTNIKGEELSASQVLGAVVISGTEETELNGKPGSVITVSVPTEQGFNEIKVCAVLDGERGFVAKTSVFTGLDVPVAVSEADAKTSADNMTVYISWKAPVDGINGGYVDSGKVVYYLCEMDENEEWIVTSELGTDVSCTINLPESTPLDVCHYAIACGNGVEINPTIRVVGVMAGKPLDLPLEESFDDYTLHAGPHMAFAPNDGYSADWGTVGNDWQEVPAPGESYICRASWETDNSKGIMMLPKFSTIGLENVVLDLTTLYHSSMGALNIYAYVPGEEVSVLGKILPEDFTEPSWKTSRFNLDGKFLGKPCVAILLEAEFTSTGMSDIIDGYVLRSVDDIEFKVAFHSVDPFVKVSGSVKSCITLENIGINAAGSPEVVLEVLRDGELVKTIPMSCNEGENVCQPLEKRSYECEFVTDLNMLGEIILRYSVVNHPECSVSDVVNVYKDREIVVDDLSVSQNDSGVALNWTEPEVKVGYEDFESMAAWCYPSNIGQFRNIDVDGVMNNYLAYVTLPYDREPKSFQIFSESEFEAILKEAFPDDDSFMTAASGDRFAVSVTPFGEVANDWLVSPLLEADSKFVFMASIVEGYMEDVEILYSSGDDSLDSFEVIDSFTIMSDGWKRYEYAVPTGGGYMAIRHVGGNYALCLDDIEYSPVDKDDIQGYRVMRNEECVEGCAAPVGSWLDLNRPTDDKLVYYIIPVVNGMDGIKSNEAILQLTVVDDAMVKAGVYAVDNYIVVEGCAGKSLKIWSVDGLLIHEDSNIGDVHKVSVLSGIYMVEAGDIHAKLVVR